MYKRQGIRWDSVVQEVWKGIGGNQEILSIEKFGGEKTGSRREDKYGKG